MTQSVRHSHGQYYEFIRKIRQLSKQVLLYLHHVISTHSSKFINLRKIPAAPSKKIFINAFYSGVFSLPTQVVIKIGIKLLIYLGFIICLRDKVRDGFIRTRIKIWQDIQHQILVGIFVKKEVRKLLIQVVKTYIYCDY